MTLSRPGQPEVTGVLVQRSLLIACAALAVLALASVGVSHLALTDIAHGEADLALEWAILRTSAVVVVGLCLGALALAWQAGHRARRAVPRR